MIKKVIGGLLFAIFLAVIIFYFTASSSEETEINYHQLISYQTKGNTSSDTLVTMTYNIGYLSGMTNNQGVPRTKSLFDDNLAQAQQLLSSINPDLIGFQEIDYQSNRSYHVQQLEALAGTGNYSNALQSVNWDKRYVPFPYWPPAYHFGKMLSGQSILAKGGLSKDQVITLPKPVNAPFYYNAFYLDRLVQVVDWKVGNATIKVMNLHLEAFDKETRIIHANNVRQLYESFSGTMPVILMGDFNSPPAIIDGEDAMDIIMSAANIASAIPDSVYNDDPTRFYTFSSGRPSAMIDYVLYNPSHIRPIDAYVPQAGEISDHLPLVFKFSLIEQP